MKKYSLGRAIENSWLRDCLGAYRFPSIYILKFSPAVMFIDTVSHSMSSYLQRFSYD